MSDFEARAKVWVSARRSAKQNGGQVIWSSQDCEDAYLAGARETARADAEICNERIKLMNALGCDAGNKQTLTHAEIQYEHLMEAAKIKQLILAAARLKRSET